MIARFLFGCVVVLTCASAHAQSAFPKPSGYVNDYAGVLMPAARAELNELLRGVEQKTSSEIAVAIVTSLNGVPVEDYANRMFKEWGVGQEKADNGVLVVVSPADREMRIEVGYGLEGVIPDGLAGEIIRTEFLPRFRQNDYAGGIDAGVRRIAAIVERNQVVTPEELARLDQSSSSGEASVYFIIPFLGLFVAIGFFLMGVGIRTKTVFGVFFGSFFGGMPLVLSLGILFWTAAFTLLPLALLMAAWGYRRGAKPSWRDALRKNKDGQPTSGDGWVMGTSDSSDSSSSSSSSSDSFGGGSSGGGGASGRW